MRQPGSILLPTIVPHERSTYSGPLLVLLFPRYFVPPRCLLRTSNPKGWPAGWLGGASVVKRGATTQKAVGRVGQGPCPACRLSSSLGVFLHQFIAPACTCMSLRLRHSAVPFPLLLLFSRPGLTIATGTYLLRLTVLLLRSSSLFSLSLPLTHTSHIPSLCISQLSPLTAPSPPQVRLFSSPYITLQVLLRSISY